MTVYHERCTGCGHEAGIQFTLSWEEEWDPKGECDACEKVTQWELYGKEKGKKWLVNGLKKKAVTPKKKTETPNEAQRLRREVVEARRENDALKKSNVELKKHNTTLQKQVDTLQRAKKASEKKVVDLRNEVKKVGRQRSGSVAKSPQKPAKRARKGDTPVEAAHTRPALTRKISYKDLTDNYELHELKVFALVNGFDEQCANKRFQALANDVWVFLTRGVIPVPREFLSPEEMRQNAKRPRRRRVEEEEEEEEENREEEEEEEKSVVQQKGAGKGKGKGNGDETMEEAAGEAQPTASDPEKKEEKTKDDGKEMVGTPASAEPASEQPSEGA